LIEPTSISRGKNKH